MARFIFHIPAGTVEPGAPLVTPDPAYGNIGLVGSSMVMLRFTEPDGVRPSDSAGNLDDLAVTPGDNVPESFPAWTGRGRRFEGGGLYAEDLPGRDTLSVRDITVQAILAFEPSLVPDTATVYARGVGPGDSEEEDYSFGFELVPHDTGEIGSTVDLRAFWHDSAGVLQEQAVGSYEHPGDDEFVLLTVTRRWESTTRVVVRYYYGEALLAEHVSTDGDIAGATSALTALGARRTDAVWGRYFVGTLDEVRVVSYEMSPEEIRATYRRLTVHQPAGVEMIRGLIPPGVSWARDPASRIGRILKIVGQALGFAIAKSEELRETWLPGSAYAEQVARWEAIRGVSPRPRDSLDRRRARVVSLFQREAGYSRPAIRAALADLVDQPEDEIEILEYTNDTLDAFDELSELRYWLEPAPADWTLLSGTLRAQRAIGQNLEIAPSRARVSLSSGEGDLAVSVKISAIPGLPSAAIVGLFLRHGNGSESWVGIRDVGGVHRVMESGVDGVIAIAMNMPGGWTPAAPAWLRMRATGGGNYRVEVNTAPTMDAWSGVDVTGHVESPHWAGPGVGGDGIVETTALDVRFDDFVTRTPRGVRAFHWYVFRDLGAGGSPDMDGARATVRKLKPAHTHGAAITTLSVLCDNPETVCDREPLGGM